MLIEVVRWPDGVDAPDDWLLEKGRVGLVRSWLLLRDCECTRVVEEELTVREVIRTGEDSREETTELVARVELLAAGGLEVSVGTWDMA